jgi:hypothetical protein
MINHRLWGMRCYLSGAIDKAEDNGIGWRKTITPFLLRLGIVVLDPCDKPIDGYFKEKKDLFDQLKRELRFDDLNTEVRKIRTLDLRMVDISDFLITYINNDIQSCGTWEEIGLANRQKKPVLMICQQGKENVPGWVWGMLPHQHIFGTWYDLKKYVCHIHSDKDVDDMRRWVFFDYSRLMPKISIKDSENSLLI